MIDAVTRALADELRERHGAHTVVLYGSRARGEHTPTSDYDLCGIAAVPRVLRDARAVHGAWLDAFVWPEATLATPDASHVYMHGGVVVFEQDGAGTRLLEALAALHARGPEPLTDDDAAVRRVWIGKTLARVERGDPEAHYRRAMLLTVMLEDWFALRRRWFEGPRRGLARLAELDPDLHADYVAALAPGASFEVLRRAALGFARPDPEGS